MSTPVPSPGAQRRNTPSESAWWLGARPGSRFGSWWGGPGRRSVPYLLLGVLLVGVSVAGVLVWSLQVGQRRSVLALARPVAVGQLLAAQDLRQVSIAADPGVATVAASEMPAVLGRPMATSLPAGVLLSPQVLGPASVPGPGQAVASLAVRAGAFPPQLGPGAAVLVVFAPGTAVSGSGPPGAGAGRGWPATVVSVTGPDTEPGAVVSVLLAEDAAREVAAVPAGQLAVLLLPGGRR